MASNFLKKALGAFVEFEEDPTPTSAAPAKATASSPAAKTVVSASGVKVAAEDIGKFEQYFEKLFDETNLPGPDYYEFWKTMETLEQHIPDEKTRMSASYSALSIQGLTKPKLIDTATKYKEMLLQNKAEFEKAANDKSEVVIGTRRHDLLANEEKVKKNAELIQKLTQEINEASAIANKLKAEISEEEAKLNKNKQAYVIALNAMVNKITTDIEKINTNL